MMKAIYLLRTKSRVPGGKTKFVWAFLFFFGFCLGFFYHGGSGTVSYTHLDVYKIQRFLCLSLAN